MGLGAEGEGVPLSDCTSRGGCMTGSGLSSRARLAAVDDSGFVIDLCKGCLDDDDGT